ICRPETEVNPAPAEAPHNQVRIEPVEIIPRFPRNEGVDLTGEIDAQRSELVDLAVGSAESAALESRVLVLPQETARQFRRDPMIYHAVNGGALLILRRKL